MQGTRPVGDTTLGSEGTLFSHSTQGLGASGLVLILPQAHKHGVRAWS